MKRVFFAPAILMVAQLCFGQLPSGRVTIAFDRSNVPVWHIAGPYGFQHDAVAFGNTELTVAYGLTIGQDERGRLEGEGQTILQIGADFVAADYKVSGRISSHDGIARAVFSIKLDGTDTIGGERRNFTASLKYDCVVDAEALELTGVAHGSVSIGGVGGAKIDEPITLPLPAGVNGSWSVVMDIIALKKIAGSGVISISRYLSPDVPAGEPATLDLPADLNGSFSESKNLTRLRVTGKDQGKGNSVQMELRDEGGEVVVLSVRGTVLGQKITLSAP
jgi:hypothetical protein